MSDTLKVDTYTRPPKQVIRITQGGNHRDGHEVVIEISGSISAQAIEKQRSWARRITAVEAMEEFCRVSALADGNRYLADMARQTLALLDPPATPVDGPASVAGSSNQETEQR